MSLHASHNQCTRLVLPVCCLLMAFFSITPLACGRNDASIAQEPAGQSETPASTGHPQPETVTLESILMAPDAYDGRHLRVRCYYFEGFEYVVLSTNVIVNDTGYYQVVNGKVWAVWKTQPPEQEILSKFKAVRGRTGPNYFHAVAVTGTFHVRSESGHLGEFDYLFEIEKMQILETD